MQRRKFIVRCGLVAAGAVLLPFIRHGRAAGVSAETAGILTKGDRRLFRLVSTYGSDVYFWGSGVFARATGIQSATGTINLLVRVDDFLRLADFLRSDAVKVLGVMRSDGNTLSFTYQGTAYTVTNADGASFASAVSGGGVARGRLADGSTAGALFTYQTLLYHPATSTVVDPHLSLGKHRIDLAQTPEGDLKMQVQTVMQGWLESRRLGWKVGKSFTAFQDELLGSQPVANAARSVVSALVENIATLSSVYSVDELRPLLLSPLVSGSLESEFGLDAEQALDRVTSLRAKVSAADYPDAALWLATLLLTPIKNGTEVEWLGLVAGDQPANGANAAALRAAKALIATPAFDAP